MKESLKNILEIQELDMKMIRLMRVKKERQKELANLHAAQKDCANQVSQKEQEVIELKKNIRIAETQVSEVVGRIERLEAKQNTLKKVEEFSALSQEVTQAERERTQLEQQVSDLIDKLAQEEELLTKAKETLKATEENSVSLEKEIQSAIQEINNEGQTLFEARKALQGKAPEDLLRIYERLLWNKKDRVVVPIENRTCSGCHIVLTAQHENLVRRGERPVFCEHCSRMHYWQESTPEAGEVAGGAKRRRRRAVVV